MVEPSELHSSIPIRGQSPARPARVPPSAPLRARRNLMRSAQRAHFNGSSPRSWSWLRSRQRALVAVAKSPRDALSDARVTARLILHKCANYEFAMHDTSASFADL